MKRVRLTSAVLVLGWAAGLSAAMIDNFDYPDQAALNAVWRPWTANGSSMLLASSPTHSGSGAIHGVALANNTVRSARDLDSYTDYVGTDASPVRFEFWIYDENPALPTLPNGARNFNEIRAYAGDGLPATYSNTGLQGLIAMGLYNTPVSDDNYHARVYYGGVSAWFNLNTPRTPGWHKLTAQIAASEVRFLVDDQPDMVVAFVDPAKVYAFDGVVLGSGLTSGGYDVFFDDLSVVKTPEPAALLVMAAAGLLTARRRRG